MIKFIKWGFILSVPPGLPELYLPVVLNSTSLRVEWNEVECTQRNGIITGYIIQYNILNDNNANEVTADAEATNIVITGLSRFNLYLISIAAMNSIGTGVFSEMFTFVTCKLINVNSYIHIM